MSTCPPPWPITAFLGLGTLGRLMAARLQAAGAWAMASPASTASGAEIICLCLSDDAAVRAVLLDGPDAAITGLAPGSLVVDFSTIAPATSEALAARLAERGMAYLDTPVTGGPDGARAGLSVLVGGSATSGR